MKHTSNAEDTAINYASDYVSELLSCIHRLDDELTAAYDHADELRKEIETRDETIADLQARIKELESEASNHITAHLSCDQ